MTVILVRRGDLRAAIASVLPHAGKESEDTPDLGRLRFAPTAGDLLTWTTDYGTSALAAARITSHVDGVVDGWDLSTQACRQVLAVFSGPTDKNARAMWEDGDLRIEVTDEQVVLSEVDMVPGRTRLLRVPRILRAGEDTYPDVPRSIHRFVTARASAIDQGEYSSRADGLVSVESLSKLIPSGKAWSECVRLTSVGSVYLARCGTRFTGVVPLVLSDESRDTEHEREQLGALAALLGPLRRPLPPPPPPAEVVEDLKAQAAQILRFDGSGRLRVIRDDDPTALPEDVPLPLSDFDPLTELDDDGGATE